MLGSFQRGREGRVRRQVAGQVRVGRGLRLLHRRGAQGSLSRVLQRLLKESESCTNHLRCIQVCDVGCTEDTLAKHANKDVTRCMMNIE